MFDHPDGPRAAPACPEDGTPHDVTILYDEDAEEYRLIPNNEKALSTLLTISPEGCEGLTVGAETVPIPWIGAWFIAESLRDDHGLTIRERRV